jgi:GDP-4-dehydro-6-deoxy-D-mannose reductase
MTDVLVTGASGFAGGHLVQYLAATHSVVGWTRSNPPSELADLARWERVDLLDRAQVRAAIAALRPAQIYHCAGVPHVADSWRDTSSALEGNVLATEHLFDGLRRSGVPARVLVPGSSMVYAPSDEPVTEEQALAPASPYALSKLAQEELARRALREDGIDVVITRSFNHTGPRQTAAFVAPSMARQIALIEAGAMEPVIKVGNLEARRDLTDVRDVVRAYAALMTSGASGVVYNVASGTARSIRSVLDALIARSRVAVRVERDPSRMRPSDVPTLSGDALRLRNATGWAPSISFDQMLDDLLAYWRGQTPQSGRSGV